MNEWLPENPDFGLEPKRESQKQKHIMILFSIILICVVLGTVIFNLWNIGEVHLAKDYVREHYGDNYSYVSSKALYTGGGCVASPKENVTVIFQGNDLSVITVIVKNGEIVSVSE